MSKRLIGYIILANLLLTAIIPISLLADEIPWWNDNWSFRIEVDIPIDTSNEHAKFQPIDIALNFNDMCWALNENEHSIRVIYQKGERFIELESQIYDLNHKDNEYIDSCNLVFLIPAEADGEEKYFVYYDDERKTNPDYPNHVDVEESYYQYEPIPGMGFESSFYKIMEEGYIVYGVNKEGKFLNNPVSQQVTKLKKGSKDILPYNGDHLATFSCIYYWLEDGKWKNKDAHLLVKKQTFVDGNLMVKFGIVSETGDGTIRSTVIYKYYYCPTEDKRLYTHVKHEVVKHPLPLGDEIDVSFILFQSGSIKSSTIEELNFGEIQPYLHFYSDEERVLTQELDQYPDYDHWEEIIGKKDDHDLGSLSWLSIDYGKTGKAHGLIFESNNVLKSGDDEGDGIELQLFESQNIQLPGLIGRSVFLYIARNWYEEGEAPDDIIPENYVVEFNAEYFTTEEGGYPKVEEEAKMYHSLISYQPTEDENITDDEEELEKFNLTAYVHLAPSFPLGSLLSNFIGINVSYLSAEVYKDDIQKSSGVVCRLPLSDTLPADFEDMNLLEKIKTIWGIFDFKNFTLFKKIEISNLEAERYLIKIFREQPILRKERQFIGYTIVELEQDMDTHIYCKNEGKVRITVLNQHGGEGIENAQIHLLKDNTIIASSESNSDGIAIIKAPCGLSEKYTLNVTYKGFLIDEKQIRLGRIRRFLPLRMSYSFDVHDLKINITDSNGKISSVDVDLTLTSDEMQTPVIISPDSISDGAYFFKALYPANYTLKIKYDLFEIEEKISIPDINSMDIKLNDFTAFIEDNWDLPSEIFLDVTLTSQDFDKKVVLSGEKISTKEYQFYNLYPGNYSFEVNYKQHYYEEVINIPYKNNEKTFVFNAEFNVTTTVLDSRGYPLKDAKVIMTRNGKEINGTTGENGEITFSIPPGSYNSVIYYNGEKVAQRKVDVLTGKKYSVVTTSEPIFPFIVIGVTIIFLLGAAIISYRKKDPIFFLKILAVSLAIVAIISPWWGISGSSSNPHFEASTKVYLVPTEIVTTITNSNVTAGELASLDERVTNVVALFPITITISIFCILANLIFNRYKKQKSSFLTFLLALIFFIGSNIVFFYAMSLLANITVGNFLGSGNLEFAIPGEKIFETIPCSWGPDIGFYLLLGSAISLTIGFYLRVKKSHRLKKF